MNNVRGRFEQLRDLMTNVNEHRFIFDLLEECEYYTCHLAYHVHSTIA
jgi:hypothetical protein